MSETYRNIINREIRVGDVIVYGNNTDVDLCVEVTEEGVRIVNLNNAETEFYEFGPVEIWAYSARFLARQPP